MSDDENELENIALKNILRECLNDLSAWIVSTDPDEYSHEETLDTIGKVARALMSVTV